MSRGTTYVLGIVALILALRLPASASDVSHGPLVLADGWQFALDPGDTGLSAGWQLPKTEFPAQRMIRTGASLADQGIEGYRGYSWFRQAVPIPDGWRRILLGFGAVDVAAQVFVNGADMGQFDDAVLGPKAAIVDLTGRVRPGQPALIVFRLRGEGGFGGIKQTVRLGQDESQVMTNTQYGLYLHQQHPDWAVLPWMDGRRRAWTVIGLEGAKARAVAGVDGSFSPWAGSFSLSAWLYDQANHRLVSLSQPQAQVVEGTSLPVFTFQEGPWRLREELLPAGDARAPAVQATFTLLAAPGPAYLYVAARPYTISGGLWRIASAGYSNGALWLNGWRAAVLYGTSDMDGGAMTGGDASTYAASGAMPPAANAQDPAGLAQGLMRASLPPGATISLVAPSLPKGAIPALENADARVQASQQRLNQVRLELPDSRLQQAFYASLGYITGEISGGQIHPGPLLHDAFWVRDAAMIGYALDRAGLADAVRGSAQAVLQAIRPDGSVSAITDASGQPRSNHEWDAPGEAAFATIEYARWSSDTSFLAQAYPKVLSALQFALTQRDNSGLLPPNESAEDLGAATQHHYWDDLWLLTGLQEARWAAQALGRSDDAAALDASIAGVRSQLLASIAATGSDVIPNGPEDLASPAMARGSTPALWPVAVLDHSDPRIRRSFRAYYQRFIQPNGGAYHHLYGQWWPYGGLELAHAFLFLGMRPELEQTLSYTLDHQTFPGLFAWAEGADPTTSDFAEGDMPHGWAAAEMVNLIRDMLLYEDGDQLIVGGGVPSAWAGQRFSIRHAPTRWGPADMAVAPNGDVQFSGVQPPGGIELRLPFAARLAP
jgi:hypothetical protein